MKKKRTPSDAADKMILLVDDEVDNLMSRANLLSGMGYNCLTASSGEAALTIVDEKRPSVILTDQSMDGGMSGIDLLEQIKQSYPEIVVIIFTGYGTIQSAVKAMQIGAFDYIPKPFTTEQMKLVLDRALEHADLAHENTVLRSQLKQSYDFEGAIGTSPKMKEIFRMAKKIAPTEANVLITGESGTGKEVIARGIHYYSNRSNNSFIAVDPAVPSGVLESELFGHVKGAFTNAIQSKAGLFEMAKGGTLFLDEISEIDIGMQAKFLRVLQEREFRRVGGRELIRADFRLISATNRVPEKAVEEGVLREDLFYRLKVIHIVLPPLRERREDIPLLTKAFIKEFEKNSSVEIEGISDDALETLMRYNWPGNVRELQGVIERAVSLTAGPLIQVEDLDPKVRPDEKSIFIPNVDTNLSFKDAKALVVGEFVKHYIIKLLEEKKGVITKVAEEADLNRKTIYRLMEEHGINPKDIKHKFAS